VRTFFLFYLLAFLLRSPLLALVVLLVLVYAADARWRGRWFDPARLLRRRRAIADLRRAVSINQHDAAAHNDLGRLLMQQGRFADALTHLEYAMRRMADSAETNYSYGACLLRLGRAAEGEPCIRRALEIHPRHLYGEPQTLLARHFLARSDYEQARHWAAEAVRINTSNIEGWVTLGSAERELGRRDAALKAFATARDGYHHLPRYLRLPNRRWLVEAKRGVRSVRS
jgi:tetratricopeptide (TPR) repeat protein